MSRLVWFRDDLRMHDNEMLSRAVAASSSPITFIYILDESVEKRHALLDSKRSQQRSRFLHETLSNLRLNLQKVGADLICLSGETQKVLVEVCQALDVKDLFYSFATTHNERNVELAAVKAISDQGCRLHRFQSQTLICDRDFPNFDLYAVQSFSKFRKCFEDRWIVRQPFALPGPVENVDHRLHLLDVPRMNIESDADPVASHRGFLFQGGEDAALERLNTYFWEADGLKDYRETRNGLLTLNESSKFSPYLALGALSPRTIFRAVQEYELKRTKNASTRWFVYELLWRDYFRFQARTRGSGLFRDHELNVVEETAESEQVFLDWCEGRTSNAFVNAAMIELKETGWMSNRMRQVAASFLIFDLGLDWRWGAEWYQARLIDYDPASNWGNWTYIAGVGGMNRPHRFDIEHQQQMYDPEANYRRKWLGS